MTALLLCWVVFPIVLFALALGCGFAVERVASIRLPPALVAPVGLAVLIVVVRATVAWNETVPLTVPVVVAIGVAGIAVSTTRLRKLDGSAFAAAGVVYLIYGAPVLASGSPTFAGYITLDDTATWLALTDYVMANGDGYEALPPSTYEATISYLLAGSGYPIGSLLPLGIGQELLGQDGAWLFQPYLAFLAALLALAFWTLLSPVVESKVLRAALTVIAAQPALLYAYAFWSGVKELCAAALVATAAALLQPMREGRTLRAALPLAAVTAAIVLVLSIGGLLWIGVILLVAAVIALTQARREVAIGVAAVGIAAALLAAAALTTEGSFVRAALANLTGTDDIGNLIEPLSRLQVIGIWPAGDFRFSPNDSAATYVLIAVAATSAALGFGWAVKERHFAVTAYVASAVLGLVVLFTLDSPWLEAKGMATASPAVLLAAVMGAGMLFGRGRRVESVLLLTAIASGVLWSNWLAYRDVYLAPRERLRELETIGERFAGQGPALLTEYEPYGARHFLRKVDAEGASELRRRPVPLTDGRTLAKGEFADVDAFQLDDLLVYRTLVLRRSPAASRPPSIYELRWRGSHYEVWQRHEPATRSITARLPAGSGVDSGGVIGCDAVLKFARALPAGSRLVGATPGPVAVLGLAETSHPSAWQTDPANPGYAVPTSRGTAEGTITVPSAGEYEIWLGGSFRRRLEIELDGRRRRIRQRQLNTAGQFNTFGVVDLAAGPHALRLTYGNESPLSPGSDGEEWSFGPIVAAVHARSGTITTPRRNARALCGRRVDWIEGVAG